MEQQGHISWSSINSCLTSQGTGSSVNDTRASRASTNTVYSHSSLPNVENQGDISSSGYLINATEAFTQDCTPENDFTKTARQNNVAEQAQTLTRTSRRTACSYCDCTFGKISDWKRHFEKICSSLGPGSKAFQCTLCANLSRTKDQAGQHRRLQHRGHLSKDATYGKITLPPKNCFACVCKSIFSTLKQLFDHLRQDLCTAYEKSTQPCLDQHSRVIALLQVGRASGPNEADVGIYAEVLALFHKYRVPPAALNCLRDATEPSGAKLINNIGARRIANQLEWGSTNDERLLSAGYGFAGPQEIIEATLGPLCLWYQRGASRSLTSRSGSPQSIPALEGDRLSADALDQSRRMEAAAPHLGFGKYPAISPQPQGKYPESLEHQIMQVTDRCPAAPAIASDQDCIGTRYPKQLYEAKERLAKQSPDSVPVTEKVLLMPASLDWQSPNLMTPQHSWRRNFTQQESSLIGDDKSSQAPRDRHVGESQSDYSNDQTMAEAPELGFEEFLNYYVHESENLASLTTVETQAIGSPSRQQSLTQDTALP